MPWECSVAAVLAKTSGESRTVSREVGSSAARCCLSVRRKTVSMARPGAPGCCAARASWSMVQPSMAAVPGGAAPRRAARRVRTRAFWRLVMTSGMQADFTLRDGWLRGNGRVC